MHHRYGAGIQKYYHRKYNYWILLIMMIMTYYIIMIMTSATLIGRNGHGEIYIHCEQNSNECVVTFIVNMSDMDRFLHDLISFFHI